jgi:hypothetical protein
MHCNPADGSDLELMACGLRNVYGIGFLPDGRLIAIDHGADDRGSRSVGNAPDLLYEIWKGAWYGSPDFISREPITDPKYLPKRGPEPTFVLANHDELPVPETPLLRFSPNTATAKFDAAYSSNIIGGYSSNNSADDAAGAGQQILLFVALFGDERPMTAPIGGPRVGRAVVCVDANNWTMHTLIDNDNDNLMSRPINVRLNSADGSLYILDFGKFEICNDHSIQAEAKSGKLWLIVPTSCLWTVSGVL